MNILISSIKTTFIRDGCNDINQNDIWQNGIVNNENKQNDILQSSVKVRTLTKLTNYTVSFC
jgi:hypothetical protein